MNLKVIFSELFENLDKLDNGREEILKKSRQIIRDCSVAIKNIHRNEVNLYQDKVNIIKSNLTNLQQLISKDIGAFSKYLKVPEQEYAEAISLHAIINNKDLPSPSELKIDPLNYTLGLADVIGELRRYVLDNIRSSNTQNLTRILETMDEIYSDLFSVDYPSGLTQDLRQKTDKARGIIEKTRGDISITLQMNNLKNCIEKNIEFKK
ncbi:MAG: haloacid dehalogenase [Candidatus Lokiarchaeota archaeon]|nr:haloacid dehalogenase [Candidatus Lokiarchaeota archaeon]